MIAGPVEPARDERRFVWAILLLALAGAVDATAFMHLRGMFVSFMSGNTTQVAVLVAGRDWLAAARVAAVIGAFVIGVVVGDLIAGEPPRHGGLVLAAEALLVLLAWCLPPFAGPLLALAMGMHNALVLRAERVGIALTYVTGTLVHFGRAIAARLARRSPEPPCWPYSAMWGGLAGGGIAGAIGFDAIGSDVLIPLAALLGAAGLTLSILEWRTQ